MAFNERSLDDYVDVAERITEFYDRYPDGSLSAGADCWRSVQAEGWDKNGDHVMQTFVVYRAEAYRTPSDPRPGIGVAWEVFPGRTPYTRGSEIMNAETSAWGRALAALGIATKRGIASRQEVESARARYVPVGNLSDGERDQAGLMTRAQVTEHGKLQPKKGEQRPVTRLAAVPDDDPFYDEAPHTGTVLKLTKAQSTEYHAKFNRLHKESGVLGDEARRQRLLMTEQVIGRPVASSAELTRVEAAKVIAALDAKLERGKP